MTLTSNETAWAVMGITLIYGSVQAWVVFKLQTAKNSEKPKKETKNSFVRLVIWLSNLIAAAVLVFEILLSAPISRQDVFLIVWATALLLMSLMLSLLSVMGPVMREMFQLHKGHREDIHQLMDLAGLIVKALTKRWTQMRR